MTMQDKAAMAAFETIVARGLVGREELKRWIVDTHLDWRKTHFKILFRNANNSRRIECEVLNRLEPLSDGGVKMSVEITMITAGASSQVPESPWTDVLFDADRPRTVRMSSMLRKRAA
ncbi:hypothetical protein A3I41_00530 [Candidatus Uhrbacteria bacterium RIFCSPLOWO2_02_FULL_48_18]|uniref:Uncharacterized protein n=1 Tax=Candidatus Uhrbacteria bacterium RIFCSPLOWO2_02_FULL_48_18 TaxID=1802408 RepID=A0A1F7VCC6_9BACT|nr:MAG: hypothetical protein A2839_00685 [Candidatus Uhrbacteria bacterium RIFCSPHIGHO2_01_FULL_47_10]OGL80617.1 MAG: hypothetical protein A3B20_04450 [Candidatus Uhrbacteria bacterium RIFCSPLOWO2_01_FULL_47_17]OGL88200.1 MAG: hypothetical protein A3I41_00530 [Candidatus Uhrbacteria bacterium RIFCSPLOWO2_02_FULL_48_18]